MADSGGFHVRYYPTPYGFACVVRRLELGAPTGPELAFGEGVTREVARQAALANAKDDDVRRVLTLPSQPAEED